MRGGGAEHVYITRVKGDLKLRYCGIRGGAPIGGTGGGVGGEEQDGGLVDPRGARPSCPWVVRTRTTVVKRAEKKQKVGI